MFIDLHTHSLLSDGELLPSELIRRARVKGLGGIAITDHVDESNLRTTIEGILRIYKDIKESYSDFNFIPGVELTHLPLSKFPALTEEARRLGAMIVVAHGETLVEPVLPGTNRAAIEAGVDILAHPGLITDEDAILAKEKGVLLEITARKGHSLSNGHVAKVALKTGARLVFNTDTHSPSDLVTEDEAVEILMGSGLDERQADEVLKRVVEFSKDIVSRNKIS